MNILNLTQHNATPEQIEAGVVDMMVVDRERIIPLLTFDYLPSSYELQSRAKDIARITKSLGYKKAMIGGAPFFMAPLELRLRELGITPAYAFSRRDSVEETQPDGSVKKVNVFRHAGFIEN